VLNFFHTLILSLPKVKPKKIIVRLQGSRREKSCWIKKHFLNLSGGDDVHQLCEAGEEEFLEIMALVGMASKPLHVRRLQKALQEWVQNPSKFFFLCIYFCFEKYHSTTSTIDLPLIEAITVFDFYYKFPRSNSIFGNFIFLLLTKIHFFMTKGCNKYWFLDIFFSITGKSFPCLLTEFLNWQWWIV